MVLRLGHHTTSYKSEVESGVPIANQKEQRNAQQLAHCIVQVFAGLIAIIWSCSRTRWPGLVCRTKYGWW
jgi:hypothetical protein